MRYKIVEADSRKKLASRVEMWYSEGWRLQGGVAISIFNRYFSYCQAMIKE
tara:strand:+ start:321 stop:473 length:153 start_codon:yes stop_codon:yes gene_type:complete